MSRDDVHLVAKYIDDYSAEPIEALDAKLGQYVAPFKEKADQLDREMTTVNGTVMATHEGAKKLDKALRIRSSSVRSLDEAVKIVGHQVHKLSTKLVTSHRIGYIEKALILLHKLDEHTSKHENAEA